MVRLVIAEKPSVGRDLGRQLGASARHPGHLRGRDVWVTWCIGHVAELAPPEAYGAHLKRWARATLPMLPERFVLRGSPHAAEQFAAVTRLLRDRAVTEVVNACDAGREGELIFAYALELAGVTKPVRRLWLASLTDAAIRQAWGALRPRAEFAALEAAARCRSEADWLVGLNATRALTLQQRAGGADALCTVGRVQTPTLALVVRREAEIEAFVPEPYFLVRADFTATVAGEAARYRGLYTQRDNVRVPDAAAADAIVAAVRDRTGAVRRAERRETPEPPPLLYDLTALQRRANARYHLSAADTLAAAQALPKRPKPITYPRTDSNFLTADMVPELAGRVAALAVPPYVEHVQRLQSAGGPRATPRIVCDREVNDHHAIIPSGRRPQLAALSAAERQVFDLVARRFLAAFAPPARYALTTLVTQVAGHDFVSRGRVCLAPGWQAIEPPLRGADAAATPLLPAVAVGDAATVVAAEASRQETKPPPRYNDAMLLAAMERAGRDLPDAELRRAMKDSGLGTPATRAAIIETLLRRQLLRRDARLLVPTTAGRTLVAALPTPSLKSPQLTGEWEARLAAVARGELTRAAFMAEVRTFTRRVVDEIFAARPGSSDAARPGSPDAARPGSPDAARPVPSAPKSPRGSAAPRSPAAGRSSSEASHAGVSTRRGDTRQTVRDARAEQRRRAAKKVSTANDAPRRRVSTADGGGPSREAATSLGTCPQCRCAPVIAGRHAWGCGRWREGCSWRLPFVFSNHRITAAQLRQLVAGRPTRRISRLAARLVLDGAAPGGIRLVPAPPPTRPRAVPK